MRTRPVFDRLPVKGYQDNVIVDAVTSYYDERLVASGMLVQELHLKLNPDTCPPEFLDWLAFMVGMVQPYYSNQWTTAVKRMAVRSANDIFKLRGTLPGIRKALDIHAFDYTIYTSNDLKLAFTFGTSTSVFGKRSGTPRVVLPLKYARNGYEFAEAQKVADNYSPVVNPIAPCYDRFYLGFSVFNDPVF